jgi:hypothetical protein
MDDVMAMKRTVGSDATEKIKREAYEQELRKLQVELCHLQDWVKEAGRGSSSCSKGAMPRARVEPSRPSPSE